MRRADFLKRTSAQRRWTGEDVLVETLRLREEDLRDRLLPRLIGTVFHVTSGENWPSIRKLGKVASNRAGKHGFTFPQSEKSYGRRRGYVCLFDLRIKSPEQIQDTLDKFYFLNCHKFDNHSVFLLLAPEAVEWLVSPPRTHAEVQYKELWIPESEIFYPADLPLEAVATVLDVRVSPRPVDPKLLEAYRELARLAGEGKKPRSQGTEDS